MRVVLLSETFSKNMGYMANCLPNAFARHGADVHLVTMDLPPYYQIQDFKETYSGFADSSGVAKATTEKCDGYTLHILPHARVLGYMRMVGMFSELKSIQPDIVQTMMPIGWLPFDSAAFKPLLKYKLFTGNHTTKSVFPLAGREIPAWHKERLRSTLMRAFPGRLISFFTHKCYGATIDCADVAVDFFGVQNSKIDVSPLGVDTDIFHPLVDEADLQVRADLRGRLQFSSSDIVCIYTGRFSNDKNPLVLAKAVARLVEMGQPFRGLFLGNGVQREMINSCAGCITHPFVPFTELGQYFRASDIGVWPTQESMSMIDAAACGLPIVVNDTLIARERIDGNGITYRLNEVDDMVRALQSLQDLQTRNRLGSVGAKKMASDFSWDAIAKRRLSDYEAALMGQRKRR